MAAHVFKGNIKAGTLTATFLSDFSNVDTDLLFGKYANSTGGNAQAPHATIAPGASGTITFNAPEPGLLEIFVDTGHETETGRLQTASNGTMRHDEPIPGPVRWVYTVIK